MARVVRGQVLYLRARAASRVEAISVLDRNSR